tara:strand:- start:1000 stop:2946 length:1947 start_codon:yes stop_codon:yes gene_type:complete
MSSIEQINVDETINMKEFVLCLWAYKLLIFLTCSLGIFIGGFFALNSDKKFTSGAVFHHSEGPRQSTFSSLSAQFGNLTSSGLGGLQGNKNIAIEELKGRVFIETLEPKLNFTKDTYFNKYDPNYIDPTWKALVKKIIGYERPELDSKEVIWQSIVKQYSKNISITTTKSGATKITVTHRDNSRAAEIANAIMVGILDYQEARKNKRLDSQIDFLSRSVANALNDLELSQSKLKTFALENSALPLESFAEGSLELEGLRVQLSNTIELTDALFELELMIKNENKSEKDYLDLSKKFPIVDQVEFRSILGQSENISYWTWPNIKSVVAVSNTLVERKMRLKSQIETAQKNAEKSRLAYDIYGKLQREAKIAEATYTVLIETVKAQSMASGHRPDRSIIYEYAVPSISASSPNRSLLMLVGAIIGAFLGGIVSIIISNYKRVYYSKDLIISDTKANYVASIKQLLSLRKLNMPNIKLAISKKSFPILRDLAVEIHNNSFKYILVTSFGSKLTGYEFTKILAKYIESDKLKIAILNFSQKESGLIGKDNYPEGEKFITYEEDAYTSVLIPNTNKLIIDFLGYQNFTENLQNLNVSYDLIFVCADNYDTLSLARAVQFQKLFHISLVRSKFTKKRDFLQVGSLLPYQGLLHE